MRRCVPVRRAGLWELLGARAGAPVSIGETPEPIPDAVDEDSRARHLATCVTIQDRRPLAVPAEPEKSRLGGGPRRQALDLID